VIECALAADLNFHWQAGGSGGGPFGGGDGSGSGCLLRSELMPQVPDLPIRACGDGGSPSVAAMTTVGAAMAPSES
jgi:hypothetical protein